MSRAALAGGALAALVLVLLAVAAGYRALAPAATREIVAVPPSSAGPGSPGGSPAAAVSSHQGFLYGRVTTVLGATHEGRLRFGGDQEAFWGDYFNGFKAGNPWADYVPPDRLPTRRDPIEIFGLELVQRERPIELGRFFMARLGDVARIDAVGVDEVRVTLKSGSVFALDRMEAGDVDDGVRVWDRERGVVDVDTRMIRTIELLPATGLDATPERLHGTVRTARGELTGFIQWDREECVGSDELDGENAAGEPLAVRFDSIRSIERRSGDGSRVTLSDGRELALSGTQEVGEGNRGVYVDDPRYGRVLVSWDAFGRLDLSPAGSGPAYGDFPPGRPLSGAVTTRAGRRLAGRLVYDLDESETTETLDAPSGGVDYTIPFGLVASIALPGPRTESAEPARVTLHGGEELRLERTGDLGDGNAGLLVFVDGGEQPEYVTWPDVARIDLDAPPAMYPPLPGFEE